VVERAIEMVPESQRTTGGAALARTLVDRVVEATNVSELTDERPADLAIVLRAVHRLRPDGAPRAIDAPLIPLLDSALLTNSPGEPAVGHQVAAEIASADRIDLIMAFIRRSGIRPLREKLRRHVADGGRLRVLTTTYTGSTEAAALDWLSELGADVRVSYDTTGTRLHAKAWLFHRDSGFATAYVGSSNLTHWAQATGLEWNVRISGARNRSIVDKVAAVFESYWEEADFEPYDQAARRGHVERAPTHVITTGHIFEVTHYCYVTPVDILSAGEPRDPEPQPGLGGGRKHPNPWPAPTPCRSVQRGPQPWH
jgi:HKD family nuclease